MHVSTACSFDVVRLLRSLSMHISEMVLLMFLVAEERKESERRKTQVDYEREKKKTKMKKNNSAID